MSEPSPPAAPTARLAISSESETPRPTPADHPSPGIRGALLPFFPGLDGLRGAFAIAVLTYHAARGFPGALLAMTGFFVLSGFLITSLLLAEWQRRGSVAVGHFLANRARRLLPAAFVTLAFVAVFWSVLDLQQTGTLPADDVATQFHHELLGALFYVHNWVRVVAPSWNGFGEVMLLTGVEPSPIAHFWSLAVEEQFYLFYPLILILVLRVGRSRLALAGVAGAVIVAVWVFSPTLGNLEGAAALARMDRIYFATDTRISELLAGVLLGIAFSYPHCRAWIQASRWVMVAGSVAMLLIVYAWLTISIGERWLYNHGLLGVALVFVVIIAALTQPGGPLVAAMSFRPLRWLGERSYALYLYHFPVMLWLDAETLAIDPWLRYALQMSVTIVLAAVSYTFLEVPVRRRAMPRASGWWATAGLGFAGAVLAVPLLL